MHVDHLLYGAAYYDEYMPCDRVEEDMALLEKAGMNVIRIAESTWSTWEPEEGRFDFTHLHRALDAAKRHNISVIVGTPTYAIPSWLAKKCPDIIAPTHGAPEYYGRRQNMDITHPVYLEKCKILIEHLMEEVKNEPHVIGFQLDNETRAYDTCSARAQAMFVEYLKAQFPDIKDFNREFGLDYWSNRVDNWEAFPDIRGTINQSLDSEYRKFQRKLVTDFLAWQADIVSKYKRDDQFITQNFDFGWQDYSFGLQPEVDQVAAGKVMDIAGCDIYHPSQDQLTGMEITTCGAIARRIKRDNYLVLETEAQGNQAWLPYPGQLRLQAYSHLACGASMVEYWHWHSIHNAIESYWKGVLSHDLTPNRIYREVSVIGNEWKQLSTHLVNLKKENKVAIVADNASLTALIEFPTETKDGNRYNTILRWLSDALTRMNIEFDMIPADKTLLPGYDLVIVPALYSATESFLTALNAYVKDGGHLIATFKSAFSDEHMKIYHDTQPHILHEALGMHYDEFTYPHQAKITCNGVTSDAKEWMELLELDTAKTLASYEHHTWKQYAAITTNHYGKGDAMYIGTMFGDDTLAEVLRTFFRECNLSLVPDYAAKNPYPVSVKTGVNELGKQIIYYLNYTADKQMVTVPCTSSDTCTELLTDKTYHANDTLEMEPWGVCIFES